MWSGFQRWQTRIRIRLDSVIDRLYRPLLHLAVRQRLLTVTAFAVSLAIVVAYVWSGRIDFTFRPSIQTYFVQAEIEGPMAEDVIVLPRYAMRDESHILIVDDKNHLRTREVEVLRIDRDDVLIRSHLAPGERISISPMQLVVEGMTVQPLNADAVEAEVVGAATEVRS